MLSLSLQLASYLFLVAIYIVAKLVNLRMKVTTVSWVAAVCMRYMVHTLPCSFVIKKANCGIMYHMHVACPVMVVV